MTVRTLTAAAVLFAAAPVWAADPPLRWNPTEAFYAAVELENDLTISVLGRDIRKRDGSTWVYHVTPKPRKDGGRDFRHEIKRVTLDDEDVGELFAKLVGGAFTVAYDKRMKFEKVDGVPALIDRILDGERVPAAERRELTELLATAFKTQLVDSYFPLPDKAPVTVRGTDRLPGLLASDTKRVYEPEEDGVIRLTGTDVLKPVTGRSSLLPGKMLGWKDRSPAVTEGSVWFDRELGRPTRFEKRFTIDGTMVLEVDGRRETIGVDGGGTVRIEFSAKPPRDDR